MRRGGIPSPWLDELELMAMVEGDGDGMVWLRRRRWSAGMGGEGGGSIWRVGKGDQQ